MSLTRRRRARERRAYNRIRAFQRRHLARSRHEWETWAIEVAVARDLEGRVPTGYARAMGPRARRAESKAAEAERFAVALAKAIEAAR